MGKLIIGVNDFETWCKQNGSERLLAEWDYDKNYPIIPSQVAFGSHKNVWWCCSFGHEFESVIRDRIRGNNCPICSNHKVLPGYNDLKTKKPDVAQEWHPTKNGDLKPSDVVSGSEKIVWWLGACGHEWNSAINQRVNGSGCPYCSGKRVLPGSNDFLSNYPIIAQEWHPTKNGDLKPESFTAHSKKKVWWLGKCGHEWQVSIAHRVGGRNCPYCSNKKVLVGFNDLATTHPDLAKEWHPTKNGNLKPTDVVAGSTKKVWWKCSKGHEWEAVMHPRIKGVGCPICANRVVLTGYNDLATQYPLFANEWDYEKNKPLMPEKVASGSHVKVWWKCSYGHEWTATVSGRTSKNTGCPYCAGTQVLFGFNDLQSKYPEVAKEWHPTKNKPMMPTDVTAHSGKKVWWLGRCGHEWQMPISDRTSDQSSGCPYCVNKTVLSGFNDLATSHPEIAKEWHPTKNMNLKPSEVTYGSEIKVWWLGKCGHEWQQAINQRISNKSSCPYCSNSRVLVGFNDLATTHPELAKEWHPTKNGNLKPTDITYGYGKKVWWKCSNGHEWETKCNVRACGGTGCPFCTSKGTSLPEQGVAYYLEQVCSVEQRIKIDKQEVDVYLPEYRIGIEYDGRFYHQLSRVQKDKRKDEILIKNGITVIRIKESDANYSDANIIYYKFDGMGSNYVWAIRELCKLLVVLTNDKKFYSVRIEIRNDQLRIRERINLYLKENSLSTLYPELSNEWNYEKNGILTPDMFFPGANTKVWWLGKCGHEWKQAINVRTGKERCGCPFCSGKKVLPGFNDLFSCFPELSKEWHPTKNGDLKPTDITTGNSRKVWWKCQKGHEWEASAYSRTRLNSGCPYCAGQRAIIGESDLKTVYPDIAREWHPTKNQDLTPDSIKPFCNLKVWWLGSCGHEWEAVVSSRVQGHGCPYCSGNAKRSVRNIETGEIYKSIGEATKACGLKDHHAIALCCQGKRKTAGGYHWKYCE